MAGYLTGQLFNINELPAKYPVPNIKVEVQKICEQNEKKNSAYNSSKFFLHLC